MTALEPDLAIGDHVAGRLRCATPWVEDVVLRPHDGAFAATIRLDFNMAKARVDQQGLDVDPATAATDPAVLSEIDRYVGRVNSGLAGEHRVLAHEVVMDVPPAAGYSATVDDPRCWQSRWPKP